MDNIIKVIQKAQNFVKEASYMLNNTVENVRCEGFDTRDKKEYTVDLSFTYKDEENTLFNVKLPHRHYKRFKADKKTLEILGVEDLA